MASFTKLLHIEVLEMRDQFLFFVGLIVFLVVLLITLWLGGSSDTSRDHAVVVFLLNSPDDFLKADVFLS